MKKIIIMCSVVLSGFAFADQSDNPYIYDDSISNLVEGDAPAAPGDPVPIDYYAPLLFIVAMGMIVFYKKKNSIPE